MTAGHRETAPGTPALSPRARRRNRLITIGVLTTVWILLWGTFTWANLIGGLLVAVVVLAVFPLPPVTYAGRISPVGLVRFAARFLRDLVVASVQIAVLAFRLGHTPLSAVIAVPVRVRTDLNLTLNSEALSLVPGSLVIEVDRAAGVLYVHVLGVRSAAQVERFRRGALDLEARLIAAIGSAAERRLVARAAEGRPPPPTGTDLAPPSADPAAPSADRKGPPT